MFGWKRTHRNKTYFDLLSHFCILKFYNWWENHDYRTFWNICHINYRFVLETLKEALKIVLWKEFGRKMFDKFGLFAVHSVELVGFFDSTAIAANMPTLKAVLPVMSYFIAVPTFRCYISFLNGLCWKIGVIFNFRSFLLYELWNFREASLQKLICISTTKIVPNML